MSDVIIIGAGPAGISAALYTIRSGLETTVITAGDSALAKAEKIENYYGFAEPVTAAILAVTLLDTPFTVWDALGFAAVFAMLAVLSVGGKKYAERLEV